MNHRTHWSASFLLLLALVLSLSLTGCASQQPQEAEQSLPAESASVEPEPEPDPGPFTIQYPGFVDQYFDWDDHVLLLENSKGNKVNFIFTLTDRKGTVLFQSKAVKPGKSTGWDVADHWKQNEHELTITATPVYKDGTQGNPVSQTIKVTVEMD